MALTYKNPYKTTLWAAQEELNQLAAERVSLVERQAWIEKRSAALQATIDAITPLAEEETENALAQGGLTNACRTILDNAPGPLTAQDVREKLSNLGIDLSGYTNQMAVLHTTLRRIGPVTRGAGGELYYGDETLATETETPDRAYLIGASSDPVTTPPPPRPKVTLKRYKP